MTLTWTHTPSRTPGPLGATRATRPGSAVALLLALGLAASATAAATPAQAVNAPLSNLVAENPADHTPHVMNGSVNAITQIGNKMVAAGTFTSVSPAATFADTSDDLVRNNIFAFDATSGVIDPDFNPSLGGPANSLDADGTGVYVGGTFGSVGASTAIKRVVKLTSAGAVVPGFRAVPNSGVNEVVVRGSRLYVGGAFTSIKNRTVTVPRNAFAALNKDTGLVDPEVNIAFTGVYDPTIGGGTNITRFDVTTDGSKLAAVGNFSTVGGTARSQIALLDTTGTASVASWATTRFDAGHNDCAGVFDTFMRDVDFSPDGSYLVVSTTGAFAGGAASGTLCDTTTRWETTSTGNDPSWVNYSGGDTTYGVAVTADAIYVGGHMRWQNNSFQSDNAGPGAVPREGIAALDPLNGLPFSWNPGRTRGVGARGMYASSTGLWVGSDTTRIGKPRETHGRVAFLPLARGKVIPAVAAAPLPGDLFLAPRTIAGAGDVLYRVNAGGPALPASDGGPDWTTDAGVGTGGNVADFGSTVPTDASVPPGTAPAIFATERWGASDWNFPVTADTVAVRLYFANRCSCTQNIGQRTFDVLIDGTLVLDDFDIVANVGHGTGTMKSFEVTTDGNVDIDFRNVVEEPLINGIEIIDNPAGGVATQADLLRRPVDAVGSPTGPAVIANSAFDWSTVRGAFMINGTVYYGLGDGGLFARSFNKATGAVGAQRAINLYDDPETGQRVPFALGQLTGMFFDPAGHRLYYTATGDNRLFYRYFTPESEIVGAETFLAEGNGINFSTAEGMTLIGGRMLYGSSVDGSLYSATFGGGRVTGTPVVVSSDGTWRYRAMFAPNS